MSIYERFEKHAHRTFKEAAERYLAEFQGSDAKRVTASIESVMPYIGSLRLIEVDDEAMQQFKHDRANGLGHFDRPAMVGTTNKDLTQVVTILNRACRVWRWLPSAPQLVHLGGDSRTAYPLTWLEQDKLFRQLPTGWDVGAACFAINTGVRKSELFSLRWSDEVSVPELGVFVFILNDTKNGKKRAVICNSIARRAVEAQRAWQAKHGQQEYVFTQIGSSKCRTAGKVYDTAWKASGLPVQKLIKRGIHNLRHTFGHRLRAAGVPEEDRNSLLGHNNHNLAQHYAMPDIKRLLDASELVTVRRETTVLRSAHHSDRGTVHPGSNR